MRLLYINEIFLLDINPQLDEIKCISSSVCTTYVTFKTDCVNHTKSFLVLFHFYHKYQPFHKVNKF